MVDGNMELRVYSYLDPTTPVDILPGRTVPVFLDELKSQGAGSFSLSKSDPKILEDPTLLDYRNLIKAVRSVDGVQKIEGALLIGTVNDTEVSDNEEAGRTWTVAGEGLKGWLRDSTVYPYLPLTRTSSQNRIFNWASPTGFNYSGTEWNTPRIVANYELKPKKTSTSPFKYRPASWPDCPQAKWVWGRAKSSANNYNQPEGYNYFRYDFKVSAAGADYGYSFFAAAADNFVVFLDGEQILESDEGVSGSITTYRYDIDAKTLQAGTHTIGVRVYNKDAAAGLIASFWRQGIASKKVKAKLLSWTGMPTLNQLQNEKQMRADGIAQRKAILKSLGVTKYSPYSSSRSTLVRARDQATSKLKKVLKTYRATPAKPAARKATRRAAVISARADLAKKQKRVANFVSLYKWVAEYNKVSAKVDAMVAQGTLGWMVNPYPTVEPGWTVGGVMLTLLAEAKARGVRSAGWLRPTFTNLVDSNGVAWDRSVPWSFNIGDDLLSVFSQLEELACDIWIDPATLEINAYGSRGQDLSFVNEDHDAVVLAVGKNLTAASSQVTADLKNTLLVNTTEGWVEKKDTDSAPYGKYGRLEGTLSTGATKDLSNSLSALALQLNESEQVTATYEVEPVEGAWPGIDFEVGDYVLAPDSSGVLVKRRVVSISATETSDNNRPAYVLEFDTIYQTEDALLTKWLGRIAGGAMSLTFANAGLPNGVGVSRKNSTPINDAVRGVAASPSNVQVVDSGEWSVQGNPTSKVTLTWDAVTSTEDYEDISEIQTYRVFAYSDPDDDGSDDGDGTGTPPDDDGTGAGDETLDPNFLIGTDDEPDPSMDDSDDPLPSDAVPSTSLMKLVATVDGSVTSASFVAEADAAVTYYVQAVTTEDAASALSEPTMYATDSPQGSDPLLAPTAPQLTTSLGTITAHWDGKFAGTLDFMPSHFAYLSLWVGTSSDGEFVQMGNTLTDEGDVVVAKLDVGTKYYAFFAATDTTGTVGLVSTTQSITVEGVATLDLDAEIKDRIQGIQDKADAAKTTADSANTAAGTASTKADSANTAAQSAVGIAAGKGKTIFSSTAPTGDDRNVNNLWIDSTNAPYTFDGSNWVKRTDKAATDAASAAAAAKTAADNATAVATAAQTAAGQAQTTANGKNTTFYTATAPAGTAHVNGDIWFNTSKDNAISIWSTSSNTWVASPIGNAALSTTVTTAITNAGTTADAANAAALKAAGIANGKGTVYLQPSPPSPVDPAGLWLDSDDGNKPYKGVNFGTTARRNWSPSPAGRIIDGWNGRWFGNTGGEGTYTSVKNASDGPISALTDYVRKQWTKASPAPGNGNTGFSTPAVSGVTAGQVFTFSAYMRFKIDVTNVNLKIYTDNGQTLYSPSVNVAKNTWVRLSMTFTVPTGCTTVNPVADIDWNGAYAVGDWIDATGVLVELGTELRDFIDGTLPGVTWGGLADKSASDYAGPQWIASQDQAIISAAQVAANAKTAADAANTAAGEAKSIAVTAQTSANGKNTVNYSTSAPNATSPGKTTGDIWFQTSSGIVTHQFLWSGSAWVEQTIASTVIAALDAGKITTGFLSGDRIDANTITAAQIKTGTITAQSGIIASLDGGVITAQSISGVSIKAQTIAAANMIVTGPKTNVLVNGDAEVGGNNDLLPWTYQSGVFGSSQGQVYSGSYSLVHIGQSPQAVRLYQTKLSYAANPGETWQMTFWAYVDASYDGTSSQNAVFCRNQNGLALGVQPVRDGTSTVNPLEFGPGQVATWKKFSVNFVVPAGTTSITQYIRGDHTVGRIYFDEVTLTNLTPGGSLIVDGEITAQKIVANGITANEIAANTITANEIKGGTITGDLISATAIDGMTITGALVRSAASGARTELNSNGIRVIDSSNIVRVQLGYNLATGLSIYDDTSKRQVQLAAYAFGTRQFKWTSANALPAPGSAEGAQGSTLEQRSGVMVSSPTGRILTWFTAQASAASAQNYEIHSVAILSDPDSSSNDVTVANMVGVGPNPWTNVNSVAVTPNNAYELIHRGYAVRAYGGTGTPSIAARTFVAMPV